MYLKLLTSENVEEYAFVLPAALTARDEFLGVVSLDNDGEALGGAVLLPRDEEDEELTENRVIKRFLLENEFVTMREYPIYSLLLSDLRDAKLIKTVSGLSRRGKDGYDRVPLDLLSKEDIEDLRGLIAEAGFTDYTDICDGKISFVCFQEDRPAGCLLATDDPDDYRISFVAVREGITALLEPKQHSEEGRMPWIRT